MNNDFDIKVFREELLNLSDEELVAFLQEMQRGPAKGPASGFVFFLKFLVAIALGALGGLAIVLTFAIVAIRYFGA